MVGSLIILSNSSSQLCSWHLNSSTFSGSQTFPVGLPRSGISSKSSLMRTQRLRVGSAVVRVRDRFKPIDFWSFLANLEEHIQFHSLQDLANMRIDIDQSKPPTICFHVLVERDEGAQFAAIDVPYVAEVQEQMTMA